MQQDCFTERFKRVADRVVAYPEGQVPPALIEELAYFALRSAAMLAARPSTKES